MSKCVKCVEMKIMECVRINMKSIDQIIVLSSHYDSFSRFAMSRRFLVHAKRLLLDGINKKCVSEQIRFLSEASGLGDLLTICT